MTPASGEVRVLVIEDDLEDIRLLKEELADAVGDAFTITAASSLSVARQALQQDAHDAVLLDLGLPDSDGLATLEAMRELAAGHPVVVLTGLEDEHIGLQAVALGAQDFLVKGSADGVAVARAVRFAIARTNDGASAGDLDAGAEIRRLRKAQEMKRSLLARGPWDEGGPTSSLKARATALAQVRGPGKAAILDEVHEGLRDVDRLLREIGAIRLLRQGRMALDRQPADLADLVRRAIAAFAPEAAELKVRIDSLIRPPLPVHVDVKHTLHALFHLLENAVEAAGPAGRIKVEAKRLGPDAVVHVTDEGPGLTVEQISAAFEPFAQVHRDGAHGGGLGVGLCLSRGLIEAQGGRLWCVSPGHGLGATFSLGLPVLEANGSPNGFA